MVSSGAVVPGSSASTLRDSFSAVVLFRVTLAFAGSGTALKPRLLAAARSASRSSPASANSAFACSPVIQPCSGTRGAGSSAARRSYCAPDHEFLTTSQP